MCGLTFMSVIECVVQSDGSDSNICSVLLQIYIKGEAILVPGDKKQHALTVMLLSGTGTGFGLTVYL